MKLLVVALTIFLLTGCSQNNEKYDAEINALKETIASQNESISALEKKLEGIGNTDYVV